MFTGSIVAVLTPMKAGVAAHVEIDELALERVLEFHIDSGSDGIVAVGTTGESSTLNEDEHCRLISTVVDMVAGRTPVIAGTGANSTTEAIHLTRCAKQAGADACLLVTPYYNKPTQEGLYLHYRAVAEAVDIPQILYNVPGRTACDLLPETVVRLASISNIVGIKDATAELERVQQLRAGCGDEFCLLSGDDASAREFILQGGDGVISVTANIAPRKMHEMCKAALQGQRQLAESLDQSLAALHEVLFVESNPIPTKWAAHRLGLIEAGIRLPLTWMSAKYEQLLTDAMRKAEILE